MSKKRIAVYIRTQAESNVEMIAEGYKKTIAQREDCELVDLYVDRGSSGMDAERPMFKRIIEDAKAGKIDYIVCRSLAKFSRDVVVAIKTIRDLKEKGVGVYFEVENMNTLDEANSTRLTLLAASANIGYILREKEKQFEAEHPEWLEEDFEEPDEDELAQIINTEI